MFIYLSTFGIIGGKIAEQDQGCVDLFLRKFERLDDTLRILPTIEARHLHDQRKIYRNFVLLETVVHLRFGQLSVLDAKRIDGWHENQLRNWEVLLILSTAQNHGIVFFDEPREVFPGGAVGICQLDVATPEPG